MPYYKNVGSGRLAGVTFNHISSMVLFLGGTENVKQTLGAVGKAISEGQDSCGAIC